MWEGIWWQDRERHATAVFISLLFMLIIMTKVTPCLQAVLCCVALFYVPDGQLCTAIVITTIYYYTTIIYLVTTGSAHPHLATLWNTQELLYLFYYLAMVVEDAAPRVPGEDALHLL